MKPETVNENLRAFALWTLAHMEAHEEWDAQTLDDIAAHAQAMRLAKLNTYGMFTRTKAGKP